LACKRSQTCYEVPLLARNSVRFLRNHDTVGNEENICGLGGISLASASIAQAWLLAAHDGVPLVLAEDVLGSQLIRQAARYRRDLRTKFSTLPDEALGVWTDVRVRGARRARPPGLICVSVRLQMSVQSEPAKPAKKPTAAAMSPSATPSRAVGPTRSTGPARALPGATAVVAGETESKDPDEEEAPDPNIEERGAAIGFAVLNPTVNEPAGSYGEAKIGLTLQFRGSACLADSVGIQFVAVPVEERPPAPNINEIEEEKASPIVKISGKPMSAAEIAVKIRRPGQPLFGTRRPEAEPVIPLVGQALPQRILIGPGGSCLPPLTIAPGSGAFFIRQGNAQDMSIKTERVDWSVQDAGFNVPDDSVQQNVPQSESNIMCQPGDTAKITFTLDNTEVIIGQKIIVCGSVPELGSWDPSKGVELKRDDTSSSAWQASILLDVESLDEPVVYKYVGDYQGCGGGFDWERNDRRVSIPCNMEERMQAGVGQIEWNSDNSGFHTSG